MKEIIFAFCILLCLLSVRAGEALSLVQEGRPCASIVIGEKPTRAARFAAAELQHVLKLVSGATLPVVAARPADGAALFVGCGLDAIDKLVTMYKLKEAPVQLYKSENQVKNFCECIETRQPTISPASVGGRSGTLCLLCNMSYQYDTGFDWDPEKMDFAGCNCKRLPLTRADCRGWDIIV